MSVCAVSGWLVVAVSYRLGDCRDGAGRLKRGSRTERTTSCIPKREMREMVAWLLEGGGRKKKKHKSAACHSPSLHFTASLSSLSLS